jgi:FdhD protein
VENVFQHKLIHWDNQSKTVTHQKLLAEEPLSIRVEGNPYAVVMRTPGDEIAHVAGFCLTEGIIDTPDDLTSIGFCEDDETNVVTVTLTPSRRKRIADILDRRGFISQTSCGLCGKELVKDLFQMIQPLGEGRPLDFNTALKCLDALPVIQPLRVQTLASHAAAIYSNNLELLTVAEDVGRHNALDKAIGKIFLEHRLEQAEVLILSSRISYELVQKSARARIPIILAHSRPTALAVNLAASLNMTLAALDDDDSGLYIFCGEQRLVSNSEVRKQRSENRDQKPD